MRSDLGEWCLCQEGQVEPIEVARLELERRIEVAEAGGWDGGREGQRHVDTRWKVGWGGVSNVIVGGYETEMRLELERWVVRWKEGIAVV